MACRRYRLRLWTQQLRPNRRRRCHRPNHGHTRCGRHVLAKCHRRCRRIQPHCGTRSGCAHRDQPLLPPPQPASPIKTHQTHQPTSPSGGSVYAFGANTVAGSGSGYLGTGDGINRVTATLVKGNLSSLSVVGLAAGGYHTVVLVAGVPPSGPPPRSLVSRLENMMPTCAHSMAGGVVYSFGYNYFGGLGAGDFSGRTTPTLVAGAFSSLSVVALTAGWQHTMAIVASGSVLDPCCGARAAEHRVSRHVLTQHACVAN